MKWNDALFSRLNTLFSNIPENCIKFSEEYLVRKRHFTIKKGATFLGMTKNIDLVRK